MSVAESWTAVVCMRYGSLPMSALGECEGCDLAYAPGEELLLLFLGSEQGEGLGETNGLVSSEQLAEGGVGRAREHQGTVVTARRQAEPAIASRHLDAHRTEVLEPFDDVIGDAVSTLDLGAVDFLFAEVPEP